MNEFMLNIDEKFSRKNKNEKCNAFFFSMHYINPNLQLKFNIKNHVAIIIKI